MRQASCAGSFLENDVALVQGGRLPPAGYQEGQSRPAYSLAVACEEE